MIPAALTTNRLATWENWATTQDGPERGVGTSGRGLADWIGVD